MRLILEGIDGVGKTTILEGLKKTMGLKEGHLGKPPKGVTSFQWADYFRKAYDEYDLLSRSHISERVYGSLIRGKPLVDEWQGWLLTQQLRVRGFKIAYVTRSKDAVHDAIMKRPDRSDYDVWVLEHWDAMHKRYVEELPPDLTNFLANDGDVPGAVYGASMIMHPFMASSPGELRGIGSLSPAVVILGDEFTRRRWDIPHAKPFDFGEASKMVFRAIGHLPRVYIGNTRYPDLGDIRSQFQLERELRRFAGVPIITLGTEALTRVRRLGREVVATLPHPQYWRRFKYADQDSWVRDLRLVTERHHG